MDKPVDGGCRGHLVLEHTVVNAGLKSRSPPTDWQSCSHCVNSEPRLISFVCAPPIEGDNPATWPNAVSRNGDRREHL